MILPWLDNIENYRFYYGIVLSRGYSLDFHNYESLKNERIISKPMGYQHKKLIDTLLTPKGASSLYAFIDNCNHRVSNEKTGKETLNFNTLSIDGELKVSVHNQIKKGEEYSYSYSPNLSNDNLIYRYGFFLKNNPNANAHININLMKIHFSKKKNELCKELKCFNQYFDDFYTQKEMETATLLFSVTKADPEKRLINAFRLYSFPDNRLVRSEVLKRLNTGNWLNYDSEIRAFAFFREAVINSVNKSQFSYVISVY